MQRSIWQNAWYETIGGICENCVVRVVFSILSLKDRRAQVGSVRSVREWEAFVWGGSCKGVAGLSRPGSLPMRYLGGKESVNSGDRGWSPKVGLMLRVSDKSFSLGIGAGVDMVRLSNLFAGYKWYRNAHLEYIVVKACPHKFKVGQCVRPSHHV